MAVYRRVFLGIAVFWGMAHFHNAAIIKDDLQLADVQPKTFTGVTSDETKGLRHENKHEDTSLTRQATLGGEPNIQKELASPSEDDKIVQSNITGLKIQMDKAHEKQNGVSDKLVIELQIQITNTAVDRLFAEITSNITSLQDNQELYKIAHEDLTSGLADVRNELTSAVGSLEERLDRQKSTNTKLASDMTWKLSSLESTDANLTTDLNSLQVKLNLQESADTRLSSILTTLQEKLDGQENKDRQFSSDILDIRQKLALAKEDQEQPLESHVNITREELQKAVSKLFCLPHRFHFQSSCYHVVDEGLTWYDAKVKCRSIGGKLAEVESSEENDYLKRIANIDGAANFWLGGTDGETENTWIWASSSGGLEFTDWYTAEPNNNKKSEHCLQLRKNYGYKWNDEDCRYTLKSVCEMRALSNEQPEVSCPKYGFQSSCYKVVTEKLTWSDAKGRCSSLGGKLAEITSSAKNDYIINEVLKDFEKDNYWIGGTDEGSEGNWKWASGGTVPKPNAWGTAGKPWLKGEPNNSHMGKPEHCLSTLHSGSSYEWNDVMCHIQIPSICEM